MTATLSMIPLAQIRPSKANPRTDFDDDRMAELIESVKRHGIISPLTLSRDGEGRYAIIAGERRYRAARAAKLREVPAQVREVDGDALTLAVAENVIRADLSPLEEARAYRRLVDEHGDPAKVAKLVGKSERLVSDRLDLLRLPDQTQELLAVRKVPLACAPALVRIAEREPLLADLAALWLVDRPHDASAFPAAPGEIVDDVLRGEWTDDGSPVHPVAYSVGGSRGPLAPHTDERLAAVVAKLGERGQPVEAAYRELPAIPQSSEYDWQAQQAEERRERECFALTDDDADAARAFGCLLELPGLRGRDHYYVTDAEWLADRLVQKIATHAATAVEKKERERDARAASAAQDDPAKEERRRERERQYEARVSGRSRNLDLGAALARWQPKLDTDAVKLLGSLVLEQLRPRGGVGVQAVRRSADNDEQAREGERPLPPRCRGRARPPGRSARRTRADADTRRRARGRAAPATRAAARRHRGPTERRPPRRLRAPAAQRLQGHRQARQPRRTRLRQEAPRRPPGRRRPAPTRRGGPRPGSLNSNVRPSYYPR